MDAAHSGRKGKETSGSSDIGSPLEPCKGSASSELVTEDKASEEKLEQLKPAEGDDATDDIREEELQLEDEVPVMDLGSGSSSFHSSLDDVPSETPEVRESGDPAETESDGQPLENVISEKRRCHTRISK